MYARFLYYIKKTFLYLCKKIKAYIQGHVLGLYGMLSINK